MRVCGRALVNATVGESYHLPANDVTTAIYQKDVSRPLEALNETENASILQLDGGFEKMQPRGVRLSDVLRTQVGSVRDYLEELMTSLERAADEDDPIIRKIVPLIDTLKVAVVFIEQRMGVGRTTQAILRILSKLNLGVVARKKKKEYEKSNFSTNADEHLKNIEF